MPVGGGVPERVTWHPGNDRLLDWTADGESLLFSSNRQHGIYVASSSASTLGRLAAEAARSLRRVRRPLRDGRRIAYTTKAREFSSWKRYRGGLAPDIWLLRSRDSRRHQRQRDPRQRHAADVARREALLPVGSRAAAAEQHLGPRPPRATTAPGDRVHRGRRHLAGDRPAEIVFQAGGRLYMLDLATEEHREVPVEVVTDRATLRPRLRSVGDQVGSAHISPSGARAVVEARGELFSLPAEHGVVRQLTGQLRLRRRVYPAWSPDGSRIAYWSDASGDYELTVRDARGDGDEETLTELGPGYRYRLVLVARLEQDRLHRQHAGDSASWTSSRERSPSRPGALLDAPALTGFEMAGRPTAAGSPGTGSSRPGPPRSSLFDTEAASGIS